MNRKEVLLLSISTFLVVVAWMILEIYKITFSSTLAQIEGIGINKTQLSTEVIKVLKTKQP
jgi:hypothetical protein